MENVHLGLNPALRSGHPALEFTNTVPEHASEHPGETLFKYQDLLVWGKRVGLWQEEQVERLARKAGKQPEEATSIFIQSLELREAIYRIFVAQVQGTSPAKKDLAILNAILARLTSGAQIVQRGHKFAWQWKVTEDSLEVPLQLIVLSVVDLMTSEDYQWVGQCADEDGCGWLFVDTSKNHSRRWCDINDCGNRAKQRRYQKRAQKQKT